MKRIMLCLLLVVFALGVCACSAEPEPSPVPTASPSPTPVPTPTPSPEPEWEPGTVRAKYGLFAKHFNRGDAVKIVGQWEDYYVVSDGDKELLVEERLIILSSKIFESYQGYAKSRSPVYPNAYLTGEPLKELSTNTKLQVLSGKGDWLYVEWEEGSGYMSSDSVSNTPIQHYYGGGGGGGGNYGADGGDIQLSAKTGGAKLVKLSDYIGPKYVPMEAEGVIGSDETEAYYIVFKRGDEVKVTAVGEDNCQLLLGETLKEVPRWILRVQGEAPYESWEGFSQHHAPVYKDRGMLKELFELSRNDAVLVLDALDDCYIVEVEGQLGYMPLDQVKEEKIIVYDYGGGGGGGGGNEWTPPAL